MNLKLLKSFSFWRSLTSYFLIVVAGIFILFQLCFSIVKSSTIQSQVKGLEDVSLLLEEAIVAFNAVTEINEIQEEIERFSKLSGYQFALYNASGQLTAISSAASSSSILRNQESSLLSIEEFAQRGRFSQKVLEDSLYLVLNDSTAGILLTEYPLILVDEQLGEFKTELSRYSVLTALLMFAALVLLLLKKSTRLEHISHAAEGIASGDFDRRIPVENTGEMKKLVTVINNLAKNSARQVSELTTDRNRLQTIFAGMVEGVIDVDLDQKILHINQAAERLLDVDGNLCRGKPLWQEVRNQEIIEALEDAIEEHSVIKSQMLISRSGVSRVIDLYAASLSDDLGRKIGAVVVLNDISELKALERVRTDFVANASHELKTPITAIRGIAETILEDVDAEPEMMRHFMQRIHAQSLRLSQLVGDLMTLSRLESSDSSDEFSKINLAELVRRALTAALSQVEEKQLDLEVEISDQLFEVMGDPQNLSQLVDNLIDNAIKYTDQAGKVEVNLARQGDEAVLRVTDSGIGISPQYQQRIFERFYRVDKARSQSLGGTGLGLSIVKNIAEKHGGKISVESQLGKGSIFIFRIKLLQ